MSIEDGQKRKLTTTISTGSCFQHGIAPVLVFGQIFSIMPVTGITYKHTRNLKFRWFSFITIYNLLMLIAITIQAILIGVRLFKKQVGFDRSSESFFMPLSTLIKLK